MADIPFNKEASSNSPTRVSNLFLQSLERITDRTLDTLIQQPTTGQYLLDFWTMGFRGLGGRVAADGMTRAWNIFHSKTPHG